MKSFPPKIQYFTALLLLLCCSQKHPVETKTTDDSLPGFQLPEGFKIAIYADNVKNARAMCWGNKGTLFVGSREEGAVYAVIDKDHDYKADEVKVIAKDLNMPAGVAF